MIVDLEIGPVCDVEDEYKQRKLLDEGNDSDDNAGNVGGCLGVDCAGFGQGGECEHVEN